MGTPTITAGPGRVFRLLARGTGELTRRLLGPRDLLRNNVPPWQNLPYIRGRFAQVPTMLTNEEINLLAWMTRDRYTGRGTIVDCGPFLGGSTMALCTGLRDNPRDFPKAGLVHSFDHFRYDPFFAAWFEPFGETFSPGDDFSPLFRRLTAPYRDLICLHQGDVITAPYEGGPIELLFLDVCKSWEINAAVIDKFFRHLVPGRSLVLQQDYMHFYAYWLVITMDFFRDYFDYLCRVDDGHTVVFRYKRRIPERLLRVDLKALPREQKEAAFERAVAREEGWARAEMLLGHARLLLQEWWDMAATAAVVRRIDPSFYDHPVNQNGFKFIPKEIMPRQDAASA